RAFGQLALREHAYETAIRLPLPERGHFLVDDPRDERAQRERLLARGGLGRRGELPRRKERTASADGAGLDGHHALILRSVTPGRTSDGVSTGRACSPPSRAP